MRCGTLRGAAEDRADTSCSEVPEPAKICWRWGFQNLLLDLTTLKRQRNVLSPLRGIDLHPRDMHMHGAQASLCMLMFTADHLTKMFLSPPLLSLIGDTLTYEMLDNIKFFIKHDPTLLPRHKVLSILGKLDMKSTDLLIYQAKQGEAIWHVFNSALVAWNETCEEGLCSTHLCMALKEVGCTRLADYVASLSDGSESNIRKNF